MEDIDGGLHPAVDGQSLDEDEDEVEGSWGRGCTVIPLGSLTITRTCTQHTQ